MSALRVPIPYIAKEPDAVDKELLVILVGSPLTENIYRRIGAKELSAHFEVVVVDCLKWVRHFSESLEFTKKVLPSIIEAHSEADLYMIFGQKKPAVAVDFLGRGPYTRSVQDACRAVGARYVTHNLLPHPVAVSSNAPFQSLLRHPWRTADKLVRHLWRWSSCRNPYPPDVALIAGSKSETHWLASSGMVIRTATEGYFELKQLLKAQEHGTLELPALEDRQYLLFIDDCLAISFDFMLGDFSPIVNPQHYHQVLNSYFDQLEQVTGLPVVIAAHPLGIEYPDYDLLFGGRKVFHNSTALLSLGCACALTHFSSAINYPVLLRKPIAILTFDKLRSAPQGEIPALIASMLQRPLLDISSNALNSHALLAKIMDAPVESAYMTYTRAYIVDTDAPGKHPFDNLVNYLKTICGKLT
jgi:hypothetical protein